MTTRADRKAKMLPGRWMAVACVVAAMFFGSALATEQTGQPPKEVAEKESAAPEANPMNMAFDESVVPSDMATRENFRPALEDEDEPGAYRVSVWRVLGSLAIVIILILGFAYVMRTLWAKGMRLELKGRHIKVMDTVQLGMNRQLFLVSVGKRRVLLGSGEKGLAYLMEIDEDEILEYGGEGEVGEGVEGGGVSFQGELQRRARGAEMFGGAAPFMNRLKSKLKKLEEE